MGMKLLFLTEPCQRVHRESVSSEATFIEGDLIDGELLRKTFKENKIEAVIHMAAYSLVGESVQNPAKYYQNNVVAGLSLLDAMRDSAVKKNRFCIIKTQNANF